ncbi:MAG: hypothetical protein HGA45_18480 [Chloroflexales bacterium]|nr:hypothetical protein [Chloroflexales bacterium]
MPALAGHLVAYHMCEPGQGGQPAESILGYRLVRNDWLTMRGGAFAELHQPAVGGAVEYLTDGGPGPGSRADYTLVVGRFLDPQAAVAEVQFADGQVVRAQAQQAGFLALRPEPVVAQSLTVRDAQGQILEQIDLTQRTGPPPPSPHPETC